MHSDKFLLLMKRIISLLNTQTDFFSVNRLRTDWYIPSPLEMIFLALPIFQWHVSWKTEKQIKINALFYLDAQQATVWGA